MNLSGGKLKDLCIMVVTVVGVLTKEKLTSTSDETERSLILSELTPKTVVTVHGGWEDSDQTFENNGWGGIIGMC